MFIKFVIHLMFNQMEIIEGLREPLQLQRTLNIYNPNLTRLALA
jgi:hypothetical protein